MSSKIVSNKRVGIHCVGADSQPMIEANRIENNDGPGIKVGIGNRLFILYIYIYIFRCKIVGNEIKTNVVGIEVLSADPFIFNNRIDKNYTDGILTKVFELLRYFMLFQST